MKSSPHLLRCIKPRPSILEPIIPWEFLNPIAHQEGTDAKHKKCPEYLGTLFPCITICTLMERSRSCIQILPNRDTCSIHHSSCSLHWITIRCSGVLIYIPKYQNGTLMQSAIVLKCIVVSWFKTVLSIKVIVRCKMYNLEVYAQSHSKFMFVHE